MMRLNTAINPVAEIFRTYVAGAGLIQRPTLKKYSSFERRKRICDNEDTCGRQRIAKLQHHGPHLRPALVRRIHVHPLGKIAAPFNMHRSRMFDVKWVSHMQ